MAKPDLKILLGINSDLVDPFSIIAHTSENMEEFIVNVLLFVRKYDFDGIDLMFDFQGSSGNKAKFTDLIKVCTNKNVNVFYIYEDPDLKRGRRGGRSSQTSQYLK